MSASDDHAASKLAAAAATASTYVAPTVAENDVERRAWQLLDEVYDPEIPMLSIVDLGIVRSVRATDMTHVEVALTPTYSGCPAIETIEHDTGTALQAEFATVTVRSVLSPAWTTDWMTERGRTRLREAGIAPPGAVRMSARTISQPLPMLAMPAAPADPACPRCASHNVERISEFGSTSCKSLWRCVACREPFDHFKAH